MSTGAALIVCVVLVFLLFTEAGRWITVGLLLLVVFLGLTACTPAPPTWLRCEVSLVRGTFETTQAELDSPGPLDLVRMYRGERVFLWPADRVRACEVIE